MHRAVLGWPWTTILAFTKIIVPLELINGGSLQLASAPTWILLQGNLCPKSNPTLLCNWHKHQIPVLPGEPSFLNDWSTGSIMEFVGNIFGNHLPEALTVPQSVMVIQKWEFSGEIFFSVSSTVSMISLPQGGKSTHISLSLSLCLTLLSPGNSQAAIDLTFNHCSSLCPSPLIWWLTPHLGLCSVDLNGSSLTLPFSDTLCQVPI